MDKQAVTVVEPGVLATLNRSELDGQIANSRVYPRDVDVYHARSHALVTRNEHIADECLYALERTSADGKKVIIEGPSVRFAEVLAQNWGNCRAGARVIEEGQEFVVAQGFFHDLETNVMTTMETRRRIVGRNGRRYSLDMIGVTANAACSIAYRQAVLRGIPQPYWDDLFQAAKKRAIGTSEDEIVMRRNAALAAFQQKYDVGPERILKRLGLESVEKIGRDEVAQLRGLFASLKEGETTIAELFPVDRPEPASGEAIKTLDDFAQAPLDLGDQKQQSAAPEELSAADHYEAGRAAHGKGAKRDQWPAKIKGGANVAAWQAGWDAADEEQKAAKK